MEAIMSILRSMEGDFKYAEFRKALERQQFSPSQKAMLNLRLSLLDSCLKGGNLTNRASIHFKKGHLTIIEYDQSSLLTRPRLIIALVCRRRSWMARLRADSLILF